MQKSILNASRSLTIKVHTLTGLWLKTTFTTYLSNKLTFSLMFLIHVFSLLITTYLFKAHDLTSQLLTRWKVYQIVTSSKVLGSPSVESKGTLFVLRLMKTQSKSNG
ncbi:hypothetical protein AAZV13_18G173300 [Glycine max]